MRRANVPGNTSKIPGWSATGSMPGRSGGLGLAARALTCGRRIPLH
jgi:hypothetical protein